MDGDAAEPGGEDVRTDVLRRQLCGQCGITVARELGARGVHVCVLESGGLDIEPDVQAQSRGESDGYPIHRLDPLQGARVRWHAAAPAHHGGGWAARPLDPIDFEVREGCVTWDGRSHVSISTATTPGPRRRAASLRSAKRPSYGTRRRPCSVSPWSRVSSSRPSSSSRHLTSRRCGIFSAPRRTFASSCTRVRWRW